MDEVKQELFLEAEDVGSREELADFIFMIVSALRDEELPDAPVSNYLRTTANAIRRKVQNGHDANATSTAKSEWRLTAEALADSLPSD